MRQSSNTRSPFPPPSYCFIFSGNEAFTTTQNSAAIYRAASPFVPWDRAFRETLLCIPILFPQLLSSFIIESRNQRIPITNSWFKSKTRNKFRCDLTCWIIDFVLLGDRLNGVIKAFIRFRTVLS